jgi:hypothetical protein
MEYTVVTFLLFETKKGIYTTTYPIMIPRFGSPSFHEAISKYKFWHPDTKILYVSKEYLSRRNLEGKLYKDHLFENINLFKDRVETSKWTNNGNDYVFLPITFMSNSKTADSPYFFSLNDTFSFLNETNIYNGKLNWFITKDSCSNYALKKLYEYWNWWKNEGEENFDKYEAYWKDIEENEPLNEDPYEDSDSWMDNPEDYWNID